MRLAWGKRTHTDTHTGVFPSPRLTTISPLIWEQSQILVEDQLWQDGRREMTLSFQKVKERGVNCSGVSGWLSICNLLFPVSQGMVMWSVQEGEPGHNVACYTGNMQF
jgi:hypothetical protein